MNKKIVVYTTPICPQCERAKKFLDENNVKYSIVDVSANQEKGAEVFKRAGHKIVPIIEIGEELIIGFDKKRIEEGILK